MKASLADAATSLLATVTALPATATDDASPDASTSERRPGQIDDPGQPAWAACVPETSIWTSAGVIGAGDGPGESPAARSSR